MLDFLCKVKVQEVSYHKSLPVWFYAFVSGELIKGRQIYNLLKHFLRDVWLFTSASPGYTCWKSADSEWIQVARAPPGFALCTGLHLVRKWGTPASYIVYTDPPGNTVEQKTRRSNYLYFCWQCSYNDVEMWYAVESCNKIKRIGNCSGFKI